jgi:hypothetical protein
MILGLDIYEPILNTKNKRTSFDFSLYQLVALHLAFTKSSNSLS